MGIWSFFGGKPKYERREERAITSASFGGSAVVRSTYSGMPVNEQLALGLPALLCGIKVISEAVGSLPPVLYQEEGDTGGRARAKTHPLYNVLLHEPNPEHTRPVFFECIQASALMYGNGYAEIERNNAGRPIALWPLHPSHVQVLRNSDTGRLIYRYTTSQTGGPPGTIGRQVDLDPENVLHIPGLTSDGSVGWALLKLARETIGFGLAAQRFGSALFKNMGRPGGVITVPPTQKLNDQGRQNLRQSFTQDTTGESAGQWVLAEGGLTFTPFPMANNEQLQYRELLQFFVYEVARLLNIPPSKLHSLEKATWANLETLNTDFLTTTLRPWLEKWESEMRRKLLMPSEKATYNIEFDTSRMIRADIDKRSAYYTAAINGGWMSVNEVRAEEGKAGIGPDGDKYNTPGTTPTPPPVPPGDTPHDSTPDDAEDDGDE